MLFVKASVLRGDFFVEKPEVLSPEADIRFPLLYAVSFFSVYSVLQNMDVKMLFVRSNLQATSLSLSITRGKQKHEDRDSA
jgi:hypothetical protein